MIYELDNDKASEIWDKLLLAIPNYNFYQSYSNGQIEGIYNRISKYLLYIENDEILAMMMCLYSTEKTTIPFGPIVKNTVDEQKLYEILTEVINYLNTNLIFSVEQHDFEKYKNMLDTYECYWDFTSVQIELENKSIDEVISNFNTNRKRILKKCLINLKDSIIQDNKEGIDEFYYLYLKRLHETNGEINFDKYYIDNIINQENTGVVLCKNCEGVLMSGLIYYQFGDTLITRHNAFNSDFAKLNPGTYLDYYMINKAIAEKIAYYDMSGLATGDNINSKQRNINRYKESYGPTKQLHYKWLKFNK